MDAATWRDAALVVAPICTLFAALGAALLGLRYHSQKELRDVRRGTYRRVSRYMFSWSSQADQLWDDEKAGVALVIRQTNELRADLALDASDEVRNAYEAWKEKISGEDLIDAVHTASEANQRRIDAEKADEETAEPGQKPSRRGGYAALRAEYEKALSNVGRAEREAVITAMDEDLKPTFFRRR